MLSVQKAGVVGLGCALAWSPLAAGTLRGWPLAVIQFFVLLSCVCWVLAMSGARRLEWRRTALDLPLVLLVGLVVLQVALGDLRFARWALGPAVDGFVDLPVPFLALGTVSGVQTQRSLGLLLTYGAVYVLTVNLVRDSQQLKWLVRVVVLLGGGLAFLGLLEYLVGESWLLGWGERRHLFRLAGPFMNPDHFASWLAMLVLLGIGLIPAGRRGERSAGSLARALTFRVTREDLSRRYLPAVGAGVMLLALVFTLSRGALVSLMGAFVFVLALFGALGRARRSLVVVGGLLAAVLVYASWIGLQPVIARLADGQSRWAQLVSSLPMLLDFPVLGVGLGAYKDIYFRYQPAALDAGKTYFPYAHNDLLQLVLELGPLGGILFIFAAWRVARDLVFAHLLGRGSCPVGGGEGQLAQRHDPFSTGIAVGALGAVVAFLVHSAFDFSARIPANSVLAAACLGIATAALHTRFDRSPQLLSGAYSCTLSSRRGVQWLIIGATMLLATALALLILRPAFVAAQLEPVAGKVAPGRVERALRFDPGNPRARALRAGQRLEMARRIWSTGLDASGQTVAPARRIEEAQALVAAAVADLRTAIATTPSDPFLHEQLGWAYGTLAAVDARGADDHAGRAVTHFRRAIVLAPQNPFLHRSLAAFALTRPALLLPVGLEAARGAVRYGPELLPGLLDGFSIVGLTDAQWLALTPDSWVDRLQLGSLLEAQARFHEAGIAYRDAVGRAPADDAVGLWLLARLLIKSGDGRAAVVEADRALARDPGNPELQLVRAQALAAIGDPAALDAFRAATDRADTLARQPGREVLPFKLRPAGTGAAKPDSLGAEVARLGALVVERLGQDVTPVRYHRLLGRYLIDRRLWQQAGAELDAVLEAAPKDAEAHFFRGQVWEGLGNRDRAIAEYREAVALDPSPAFRLSLARLLWDTEQYYQAMNEWRAILDQEPQNVEALLGLGQAHLKEGDRIAAFHRFQRILQIAPDNPVARRELAKLTGAAR